MPDGGGSSTLIFSKAGRLTDGGHIIDVAAAWMTSSQFSHVELAIGEESGGTGQMRNVLRIFNDSVGVELVDRTGKNPAFIYLQLGCTKAAENQMLAFAQRQVRKPFSMTAMVRSIVWPRTTTGENFFCAELVAACLQAGGLLSSDSNPGAATPESLYRLYSAHATVTANPCMMRRAIQDREHEGVAGGAAGGAAGGTGGGAGGRATGRSGSGGMYVATVGVTRVTGSALHQVKLQPTGGSTRRHPIQARAPSFSFQTMCPAGNSLQPSSAAVRPVEPPPPRSNTFQCNLLGSSACVHRPVSATPQGSGLFMPLRSLAVAVPYERPHSS